MEKPTIIPMFLFSIVSKMPKLHNERPVKDEEGNVIYELNYFCKRLVDKKSGLLFIEWDTDKRFAARFISRTMAENYRRVVLSELDGTEVIEMKPLQNRAKFFGKLVTVDVIAN